ncbi:allantoicase [Niveibacterium sp. SC-1]|uniref:allantoicase n=1 Tax=Niveibacterium sp. SC-1 TaxID=3135646 RepID=UPI00311DC1C2
MAVVALDPNAPAFTRRYVNLADPRLGAEAIAASDEFFAGKERMLSPEEPIFVPGKYDNNGKWMDGWESRRKRGAGHDWCVVRLARPGRIVGLDVDTRHFTGNYPPGASLEACHCSSGDPKEDAKWTPILASVALQGNSHHYFDVTSAETWTHVRLNIYPDGGIARLRVYGRPALDWGAEDAVHDFAAAANGAYVVATNNEHFGLAASLLLPGRGANMGDGWETRRRREPGNDWCILALAAPAIIERVVVDTAHFKGNYPDACSLQAARIPGGSDQSLITQSMFWPELLAPQKLQMDSEHSFAKLADLGPVTYVRFNIFPDGGVSRLRLFGRVAK